MLPGKGWIYSVSSTILGLQTRNRCRASSIDAKANSQSHGYGEGNGNPLQYSCLENPVDRGAWWAAVHRVAQSRTRLKRPSTHACFGEGNGNPLQCSCLENPRDRGAWGAAIYGVAQNRTRLKRLSSSSSHYLFWEESNEKVLTLIQFNSLTFFTYPWKYTPATQLSFPILHSWGKKKVLFFSLELSMNLVLIRQM